MRIPQVLRPGDRIGVTSPSLGVNPVLRRQVDAGAAYLRELGFEVVLGEEIESPDDRPEPLPTEGRIAELSRMLTDPSLRAVVATIGGEASVKLAAHLDWDALEQAEPTWLVGPSDITLLQVAFASRLGWASVHANGLIGTPAPMPEGLLRWTDVLTGPDTEVVQRSPGRYRSSPVFDSSAGVDTMALDAAGDWSTLDGRDAVDVTGRLVGGCLEVVTGVAGTPYGDLARIAGDDGVIVFVEAAEMSAIEVSRSLYALRLAGWFDHANAVLVGRTYAPDDDGLTQRQAVEDALGDLGVPVVLDVECGHVPPRMSLVQGALTRVVMDGSTREIRQTLA